MEGIIISTWDHIIGPQIEKLWFINDNCYSKIVTVPDKILSDFNATKNCKTSPSEDISLSSMKKYTAMCGQLLLGEVDSFRIVDEWCSRLYISEDCILTAILFHTNSWKCSGKDIKDVCVCFGIIFKCDCFNFIIFNHLVIDQHLRKAVNSLKKSQFNMDSFLKYMAPMIEDLTGDVESDNKSDLRIKTEIGNGIKFLIERFVHEIYSLTIIDLESLKIWQAIPFYESFKSEKNLHSIINKNGCLVPYHMRDLIFIDGNKGDFQSLFESFKEKLKITSCSLVKTVEHLKCSEKYLSKKEIIEMYAIKNLIDLEILLECTEHIKPGIRSSIID